MLDDQQLASVVTVIRVLQRTVSYQRVTLNRLGDTFESWLFVQHY